MLFRLRQRAAQAEISGARRERIRQRAPKISAHSLLLSTAQPLARSSMVSERQAQEQRAQEHLCRLYTTTLAGMFWLFALAV